MSDFVRIAHSDVNYSSAAEFVCASVSSLVETLNTNTVIYESMKKVLRSGDCVALDEVDRRVANLFLFDFEQSGIHLPENDRRRFVELSERILELGSAYVEGCHRPVLLSRDALPERLRNVFSTNGTSIMVSSLHADNPRDDVREAAYRIYMHSDQKQQEFL